MIETYWQRNARAPAQGDYPQTPYNGFQRGDRAIDGDWGWHPCAARARQLVTPPVTPLSRSSRRRA